MDVEPVAPTLRFVGSGFAEQLTSGASRSTHVLIDGSDRVWFSTIDAVYQVNGRQVSVLSASAIPNGTADTVRYTPEVVMRADDQVSVITGDGEYSWDGIRLDALASWPAIRENASFQHYRYVDSELWQVGEYYTARLSNGAFATAPITLTDLTRAGAQY